MPDAETDLVRFWHAVHDYLICQGNTNDQSGVATLSVAYTHLVELHNGLYERWVAKAEEPIMPVVG